MRTYEVRDHTITTVLPNMRPVRASTMREIGPRTLAQKAICPRDGIEALSNRRLASDARKPAESNASRARIRQPVGERRTVVAPPVADRTVEGAEQELVRHDRAAACPRR